MSDIYHMAIGEGIRAIVPTAVRVGLRAVALGLGWAARRIGALLTAAADLLDCGTPKKEKPLNVVW